MNLRHTLEQRNLCIGVDIVNQNFCEIYFKKMKNKLYIVICVSKIFAFCISWSHFYGSRRNSDVVVYFPINYCQLKAILIVYNRAVCLQNRVLQYSELSWLHRSHFLAVILMLEFSKSWFFGNFNFQFLMTLHPLNGWNWSWIF